MEVQDTGPGQQEKIAEGESLTIVSVSSSTSEDVLGCVEDSLRKQAPGLAVIPFRKFRNSMFPWFEPSTTLGSDECLTSSCRGFQRHGKINLLEGRFKGVHNGGDALWRGENRIVQCQHKHPWKSRE